MSNFTSWANESFALGGAKAYTKNAVGIPKGGNTPLRLEAGGSRSFTGRKESVYFAENKVAPPCVSYGDEGPLAPIELP